MPKVVGLGLRGVFELIKETRESHPELCVRALQALLDMLQGQAPEGLKTEPAESMGKCRHPRGSKPNPQRVWVSALT